MTLGLAAFLERIRSQPHNEVLLDRFLLLVADMEDSEEKVTLLFEFVSVIRKEHPKFALQVLRQIHGQVECSWVQRPQELAMQSLQILHDTMLALGREARAGLIANEMQRLREHPLSGHSVGKSFIQESVELVVEEKPRKKGRNKVEIGRVNEDEPAIQLDPPKIVFDSNPMPDAPRVNPFAMPPENDAIEALPQKLSEPLPAPAVDNMNFKDMHKFFRMFDEYIKEEGAEPQQRSAPSMPIAASPTAEPSLLEKLFGSAIHVEDGSEPLVTHILGMAKHLGWKLQSKDAKRIAAQVREGNNPLWLVSLWFAIGSTHLRSWFKDCASTEDLITMWNACLVHMVEHRMHRRALIFIRVSFDEQMHPNAVLAAYQYLTAIWRGLHLRGFTWQPEDGASSILAKLAHREQPQCQGLIIAS